MSPTLYGNFKMAVASLKQAKLRSFLTMLGVIIGVVSVVMVVGIGEGIKQQVSHEIDQIGRDLITIRPGEVARSTDASTGFGLLNNTANVGSLADGDIGTVQKTPGVVSAVPLALVNGIVTVSHKEVPQPLVLATTNGLDGLLGHPLEYGEFFGSDGNPEQPDAAVIGHNLADRLFQERSPIGRSFEYLGQTFFVRGVMKRFDTAPLSLTTDFNDVVLIPYGSAQNLTAGNTQLYEILAKPAEVKDLDKTVVSISGSLRQAHGGQQRFSVLRQTESLAVTNNILDLMTKLIAGVAAISLLVGGIGIMDVMLVSVAERMHEIGLRKALGASNRQIMAQFMTEAMVLSLVGGIVGVIIALVITFILRVTTSLTPFIPWPTIAIAVGVSLVVGTIFGTAPALKAARKDPIDALRNQ